MPIINNIEMTILVKGRPIQEYPHEGTTFVEGRAGSEYEIEIRNHTHQRVEAILSVDGLSVIDGKPAGHQSQGYMIDAKDVIRIPGWMLNSASVAKFAFSGTQQSYTAQSGGDLRNNGVIGAMVFREVVQPVPWHYAPNLHSNMRGIACGGSSENILISNSVGSTLSSNAVSSSGIGVEQSLGTAFGESRDFATKTVSFKRGEQFATLLCYYDERRGLKERGIKMERRSRAKASQPQAFPATGCQPPPGWRV